jgi:hypothetical protein
MSGFGMNSQPDVLSVSHATVQLAAAVGRWQNAMDADAGADAGAAADALAEYATGLVARSARNLTRAVDALPADQQPVGWQVPNLRYFYYVVWEARRPSGALAATGRSEVWLDQPATHYHHIQALLTGARRSFSPQDDVELRLTFLFPLRTEPAEPVVTP